MYYRLGADLNIDAGYMKKTDNYHETLITGAGVDVADLVLPWPFSFVIGPGRTSRLSDFYPGAKLMSTRLVETLRSCGVDNLQVFPAAISDARNGEAIDNYVAVNVLGLVAAADRGASRSRPLADVVFFEDLVVDPVKARGVLLFRLAESRSDLIVAEKVASRIREGNFTDVMLEPLKSVAGA